MSYALTDVKPGAGGFCVVPGSHKSNFRLPEEIFSNEGAWPVRRVPMEAGDAVIFSEAVTDGALAWRGTNKRRVLLFKCCPNFMQWGKHSPWVTVDDRFTPRQRELLAGPQASDQLLS